MQEGDLIQLPHGTSQLIPREAESTLRLEYIDKHEDVIVVNKPHQAHCHPLNPWDLDTITQAVVRDFPHIKDVGSPREPGLLHRLDYETSGILLFANSQESFQRLSQSRDEKQWDKRYLAWLHGIVTTPAQLLIPITHHPSQPSKMIAFLDPSQKHKGHVQQAHSWFVPLAHRNHQTLCMIKIITGVRHQIRIHASTWGHPIVGDPLYATNSQAAERMMLHASALNVPSPLTGQTLQWCALPSFVNDLEAVECKRSFERESPPTKIVTAEEKSAA